ncbi:MAG: M23 family metallopeptidase [Sphingomonadales bacterium]|nr:M23 family metallopeptidase [Sphingomonadales bacterium]MDE2567900.1 M23 family metallopeptidase [Sphingomonadales bacterium]
MPQTNTGILPGGGQQTGDHPAHLSIETGQSANITASRAADLVGHPVILPIRRPALDGSFHMPGNLGLPLAASRLTSGFGMRYHPLLGIERMHSGVDLAAPSGTPIVATAAGDVGFAGWDGGYGLLVAVNSAGGLQTRYAHMSHLNVAAGQHVAVGDVIGYVGSTGLSTGPHLHYEVRINGRAVRPMTGQRRARRKNRN